jgi:PAS domain-containing protein
MHSNLPYTENYTAAFADYRYAMLSADNQEITGSEAGPGPEDRPGPADTLLPLPPATEDATPVFPTAIISLDKDLIVTHWNNTAEFMFGWTAAEVLGHLSPQPVRTRVPD